MPWEWLKDNIGSIIILILVAVMLVLLIVYLVRGKKRGGGCSGCAGCPHAASCPSKMLGNKNAKDGESTEPCEKKGKKE